MLRLGFFLSILLSSGLLRAAILERLSLDEMVLQSSAIVRARAVENRSTRSGNRIYTLVEVEVLDQWKGEPASRFEIVLPGGQIGGFSQQFSGVPVLEPGQEFVAFLWTGPSGRTQFLGMSQGLFEVLRDAAREVRVYRRPTGDLMLALDAAEPVAYPAIEMPLESLVAMIRSVTASGGNSPQ
jgi:hypothetical protein